MQYMKYVIKHVKSTKGNSVLLLVDYQDSHVSITMSNLAKFNVIVLLTIPLFTCNKLQPLDLTVFGPYETYYNYIVSEEKPYLFLISLEKLNQEWLLRQIL